jgi:hypothetical protein
MKYSVTFLTRYYPPTPNINGEAVCDMVHYLQQQAGIGCNVICMDRQFEGGGQRRQPEGNVIRLQTISESKNAILRFFTFLFDGFALVTKALRFKNTFIVVTSSPPMLPFWAALLFGKKIRWAFWALDLFPEGFAASKIISHKNILYRWVVKKTYSAAPELIIALGPQQANHLLQQFRRNIPTLILPCGLFYYQSKSDETPHWHETNKIIFGYCGNLGDPHNPDFIRAVIDCLNPEKQILILAVYGNQAPAIKAYAQGKKGIYVVDNVPRSKLHFIDIHLVSLRKEWTHIAVPSKAVSAISMGKTILFCGSRNSDNWVMFQDAGWFIEENQHMYQSVRDFMNTITREVIQEKEKNAPAIYQKLQQMVIDAYQGMAGQLQKNN